MNRRAVLAAVASGFGVTAGCSGLLPFGSDGGPSSETGSLVATVDGCPLPQEAKVAQSICEGKQSDSEVFLFTRQDTVSLPNGAIDFVFRNRTGGSILYAPCRWAVYEQTNQGWKTVRPLKGETSGDILRAFETLTLYIGREPPKKASPCVYFLDELTAGRYMFGIQGTIPDTEENAGKTLFLASFRAES